MSTSTSEAPSVTETPIGNLRLADPCSGRIEVVVVALSRQVSVGFAASGLSFIGIGMSFTTTACGRLFSTLKEHTKTSLPNGTPISVTRFVATCVLGKGRPDVLEIRAEDTEEMS